MYLSWYFEDLKGVSIAVRARQVCRLLEGQSVYLITLPSHVDAKEKQIFESRVKHYWEHGAG